MPTSRKLWRRTGLVVKEIYAGALLILIGGLAVWKGVSYGLGTLRYIRPGFFPVAVGVILIGLGILVSGGALVAGGMTNDGAREATERKEWRGWLCIVGSIVAFIVAGRFGGLAPASFLIVFIAALGDRGNSWKSAFILALGMTAVTVVVFWLGLGLQFPLFRWG